LNNKGESTLVLTSRFPEIVSNLLQRNDILINRLESNEVVPIHIYAATKMLTA